MFKHILLPTDGSDRSERAVHGALSLAKELGATVSGLHVVRPPRAFTISPDMLDDSREQYVKEAEAQAEKALMYIVNEAKQMGVAYNTVMVRANDPYDAIIEVARDKRCDLIAMASHGRRGLEGLLLGSETQKVLTHSVIPVLVFR
ncbi:universal stress protein [Massilia glaciei]|uniref:Universal stress protein n=1 Tax=Massilia glaciei TaxID=1524097 RepID=A0A2U2HLS1_9BURK|nr:universal stress protein [Massilia glaciei]PWF48382.1 universal stress protein [Massilia glaciei]